ncbi:MAG: helix-turn-helix transcriptional regulator [Clostridia bacterium]|nr:helix-turn-helix transcriptional regulator [Clostridia bacterium]
MSIGEAVKARILELCRERKITINKLSTICGLTQSTLNNIMHRENSKPTVATVKKICDGLEITMAQFFSSEIFDDLEQEII